MPTGSLTGRTPPTHDAPPSSWSVEAQGLGRRDPKRGGWLIQEVSVSVHPGDRLTLLGPSGAGKTVLLRALALLDPLDAGRVLWNGKTVENSAVPAFRARVIYLQQRPAILDGTVEDNLTLPFTLKAQHGRTFDRERTLERLDALGRDATFLTKSGRDLSGGEAQVVALLRALQLDPSLVLLDEPTASLDAQAARAVERLIDGWLAEGEHKGQGQGQGQGRAFVWVSHDPEQARRVGERALRLRGGRIEPEG